MKRLVFAIALVLPAAVQAQAYSCSPPHSIPRVRPDLPSAGQPVRTLPIGGYTLAITWSPQFCRTRRDDPTARFQCGDARFGWTLHGLWPDGEGKDWPQYCRATALLPRAVIARNLCATPSAQLLQHEWAKHGTCMSGTGAGISPSQYFARSTALYRRLRYPDMDALSREPLSAGGFAAAMARANPGLRPDMMRITADRDGWLDEVWMCLDRRMRGARCPAHQGGLAASAPLRIWRGRR